MADQTLVSERPGVALQEEGLPDIGGLSLNNEKVMIEYYMLEEDSEGDDKLVLMKSFTAKGEQNFIKELNSVEELSETEDGKFSNASKSDSNSNCTSTDASPPTTSNESAIGNGNEGCDTEDEVSPEILPMDNYLAADVAAAIVSEYENRPYKPFYQSQGVGEYGAFQPMMYQQPLLQKENTIPASVNFGYGFSSPPSQNSQNFSQPPHNNGIYGPPGSTPATPLYTPFPRGVDYYSLGEPVPSTPFQYRVPSSPLNTLSSGFSFQQVPTMVSSPNGFIPGFSSYPSPAPWLNKVNPINTGPGLDYGKSFPTAPTTISTPCQCDSCMPKFEIAPMQNSQQWISYPYSPIQPMSFMPTQPQQPPPQPIFISPAEHFLSQPNFQFQFNASASEYRPPNINLRHNISTNKNKTKTDINNNNSVKKGVGKSPKLWKMSRWSEEVEKAEDEDRKDIGNSSGDSGVEIDPDEHYCSVSNSIEVSTLETSSSSSAEASPSETSVSSSSTTSGDTRKSQGTQYQSSVDITDGEESQVLTWVPNMYLVMMDGKISEKAPECFRIRETDFTLVDYGYTFYCMGEELPFVCNSGQARFRNQVVSSAELKYQYYVPPMVENHDFFGGQQNLWQIKMVHYFSRFTPTVWRLQALPEVVHHKQKGWIHYSIISKLRFCCRTCNRPWTTMRGKIVFTFCLDSGFSHGFVFMKIFGQVCMQQECTDRDFQTAANYPEEIDRIMKKLSHYIGHIYYNMPLSIDYYDQNNSPIRGGNPKSLHRRELCQACFQGMCSKS